MGTPIDVADLLRRVEVLEKALSITPQPLRAWPAIPIFPAQQPAKIANKCNRCGVDWSGVMGYVCGATNCPMQPRVKLAL